MFHVKQSILFCCGFFILLGIGSCHTVQPSIGKSSGNLPVRATESIAGEENQVLEDVNLVRQDPRAFYSRYVRPYIQKHPEFTSYYTRSLRKELENSQPVPPLRISPTMQKTAAYQANDLQRYQGQRLDHTSSNGMTFEDRMRRAGVGCAAENLYSADRTTPMQMVLDLLVDFRVRSLGHRKNLLNPMYKSIGISLTHYSGGGTIMVQDFSCN